MTYNNFIRYVHSIVNNIIYPVSADNNTKMYSNPIISGFYPDPSMCRSGDDYYMVHSTFEFFPGVPVFHSRDLVHWHQIGHCLTRKSQLNLEGITESEGIFAPTIRFHSGTFYMITTMMGGKGNFYVTAKDPAGPWSDPVWLDRTWMDPSLFFDDDGIVYYTRHDDGRNGRIVQSVLDIESGKLTGPLKEIWKGTGGIWPEGPHLYKIKNRYYLLISEGGTSYEHMATIARSDSPWGPYESYQGNPILTHKTKPAHPIQALGHPDIVETPAGWWMVCLGFRPRQSRHHMGRETFLTPLEWTEDNWPVVPGKGIELKMQAPNLPPFPFPKAPSRDNFDTNELAPAWNYLRNPIPENYSLTERPGWLRLRGSALSLNAGKNPTFTGRRQTDMMCQASVSISFHP